MNFSLKPLRDFNINLSNSMFRKANCRKSKCKNERFGSFGMCALHCEKKHGHEDLANGVLSEFNKLLNLYILNDITSLPTSDLDDKIYRDEIGNYMRNKIPIYKSKLFKEKLSEKGIIFKGILFPNESLLTYTESLRLFNNIWFEECIFYVSDFNIESTGVFFEKCTFKYKFSIEKINLFLVRSEFVFYKCIFNNGVYVDLKDESKEGRVIKNSLFEDCEFKGIISLSNAEFEREVFKFKPKPNIDTEVSEPTWLSSILINNVVFHDKCKFNYIDIVNLVIKDAKFLSKLEVKESVISYFELNNSNVSEVFDSFDSRFIRFVFYKSIFTDFSGFEKVAFGLKGSVNDMYVARFVYTTFMSFSNFRSTKFLSGLDFENSNLKEQPNFLKTEIGSKNTNRETFRIVKKSFDDVGNQLEANKFFVEEMKAYKKELDDDGDKWDRLVYRANEEISDFGRSYIKPSVLLFLSLIIYTSLLSIHESFFEHYSYFLHPWVDCLSVQANEVAKNLLPFSRFLEKKSGIEFVSLLFYIWFGILIWQIVVSVKRHTQR